MWFEDREEIGPTPEPGRGHERETAHIAEREQQGDQGHVRQHARVVAQTRSCARTPLPV